MEWIRYLRRAAILSLLMAANGATAAGVREPDVQWVPTPQEVVDEMLRLAKVEEDDLIYDLGSGDGRIVITAATRYGARGVGVDIDPERIAEARTNAETAGVSDRVKFVEGDLFEVDLSDATVVTLYLLNSLNRKLRPKLLEELRPGTPVVSHAFDMGEWTPDTSLSVEGKMVYLWIVPARMDGRWEVSLKDPGGEEEVFVLDIEQQFQQVNGIAETEAGASEVQDGRVEGESVHFTLVGRADPARRFTGRIDGENMSGTAELGGGQVAQWQARRQGTAVGRSAIAR